MHLFVGGFMHGQRKDVGEIASVLLEQPSKGLRDDYRFKSLAMPSGETQSLYVLDGMSDEDAVRAIQAMENSQ